ncbi:HMG-box domain-containing protein [Paraburkholderia sp. RL17-337-BIB-A]|uniref:hypothetical protein n=1 Tax=Paraburkholderia sp. RL17-337-BIB-A TaxID=3031636 RepID=UPI0038BA99DD
MPKQFVLKATQSPLSFLAVCFALWFAAHSFFAALFVGVIVVMWVKKSIHNAIKTETDTSDAKAPPTAAASQPKAEESIAVPVTPIKRQYAKSPVVVPLKTGTDN